MVNDKNNKDLSFVEDEFDRRIKRRQLRQLRSMTPLNGIEINVDNRTMLNFCSNDYLGLSRHPLLRDRSIEFIHKYGSGATASRLICGNYDFLKRLKTSWRD